MTKSTTLLEHNQPEFSLFGNQEQKTPVSTNKEFVSSIIPSQIESETDDSDSESSDDEQLEKLVFVFQR